MVMLDMVLDSRKRLRAMVVEGADARRDDKKREGGGSYLCLMSMTLLVWALPLAITYGRHGVLWSFLVVLQAL
jgi:hypothetical protein